MWDTIVSPEIECVGTGSFEKCCGEFPPVPMVLTWVSNKSESEGGSSTAHRVALGLYEAPSWSRVHSSSISLSTALFSVRLACATASRRSSLKCNAVTSFLALLVKAFKHYMELPMESIQASSNQGKQQISFCFSHVVTESVQPLFLPQPSEAFYCIMVMP